MNFMSTDFDLAENVFYFHNPELQSLEFVLDWDTQEKFYFNLLSVSNIYCCTYQYSGPHIKYLAPVLNIFVGLYNPAAWSII